MKAAYRLAIMVFCLIVCCSTIYSQTTIQMHRQAGGTLELPVIVNDVLRINFIFDSGASVVSISPDVALTLIRSGTIRDEDWLPDMSYSMADGSIAKSRRFKIQKLTLGNLSIYGVEASIVKNLEAPLLLGQSALNRFGIIQIDNEANTLTINPTNSALPIRYDPPTTYPMYQTPPAKMTFWDVVFGSDETKSYLDGWTFGLGLHRTNFSNPKLLGISQSYAEGFTADLGYTILPFFFKVGGFVETIETVPNYYLGSYLGDKSIVHNGLNISAYFTPIPVLKYVHPFLGVGYQACDGGENTTARDIGSSSPFWAAGLQGSFKQFSLAGTTSGIYVSAEFRQTIGKPETRRTDLCLMLGLRMQ